MKGISIITCSRNLDLRKGLLENIKETIGIKEYEYIAVDNTENKHSLASAYNQGSAESKYSILCFVHEDARFLTQDWGSIVLKKFEDTSLGALGVAGSTYIPGDKARFALGRPFTQGQVVHKLPRGEQLDRYGEARQDTGVVVLDGVCIVTTQKIAKELQFDEKTFDKFHFYDIDFTLRIAQKHKLIDTYDLLLQHASPGSFKEEWKQYLNKFKEKHKTILPYTKLKAVPAATGKWKSYSYDSTKEYPKVLVGCPTSFHKEHCLQEYVRAVKSLTYPNYDILLVDNSPDDKYMERIRKENIPVLKGPYYEGARDRIVASRNLLREQALKQGCDYLLSLEQDVIPPSDSVERMLQSQKEVITGIYFNKVNEKGVTKLTPLAYKISGQKKDELPLMKPLSEQELWSNKVVEVISAGLGCLLIHKNVLKKITFRYDPEKEAFDDRFFFIDLS